MKYHLKNKPLSKENDIISFLDKRIQRLNKELQEKKGIFNQSKQYLFSDDNFLKNISYYSKMSLLIKR